MAYLVLKLLSFLGCGEHFAHLRKLMGVTCGKRECLLGYYYLVYLKAVSFHGAPRAEVLNLFCAMEPLGSLKPVDLLLK